MSIEEIISFFESLLPYLNTAVLSLVISLGFEIGGFKITKKVYKREPLKSLFLGLCIIVLSSLISLIIQTTLSGLAPFGAFILLLIGYLLLTRFL